MQSLKHYGDVNYNKSTHHLAMYHFAAHIALNRLIILMSLFSQPLVSPISTSKFGNWIFQQYVRHNMSILPSLFIPTLPSA